MIDLVVLAATVVLLEILLLSNTAGASGSINIVPDNEVGDSQMKRIIPQQALQSRLRCILCLMMKTIEKAREIKKPSILDRKSVV